MPLRPRLQNVNHIPLLVDCVSCKLYNTINLAEYGMIAAHAHVISRVELSASLTNDDGTRLGPKAGEQLDTQSSTGGISAVVG